MGYKIFLVNLSFSSFSKMIEAARRTNESVCMSSKFNTSARLFQYMWPSMMTKEPGRQARRGQSWRRGNERKPDFASVLLCCKESYCTPRAMGKRPGRLSSLCGPFPFCNGPRSFIMPLPPKKGAPSRIMCSVRETVR